MTSASRYLLPGYLAMAVVLGGASAAGYLANAILQLAGTVLIGAALWRPVDRRPDTDRLARWVFGSLMVLVALQFVPLPFALWPQLGARGEIARELAAAGVVPRPALVTLSAYEALKSAVGLIPPIAVWLALRRADLDAEHKVCAVLFAAMTASVAMGSVQLAGGTESAAYWYAFTNRGSTTGFFANSNHLATLLLVTLPFIAAWLRQSLGENEERNPLTIAIAVGLLIIDVTGIIANGSLAGLGLAVPVVAASSLIVLRRPRLRRSAIAGLALVVLAGVLLVTATPDGQQLMASGTGVPNESRTVIFANSWHAARDFLPLGSGLGTFAEIYARYEDFTTITSTYVNHAHNDYLEILLELGVPGALAVLLFFVWWCQRAVRIWREPELNPYAAAAVIASATILLHSLVDYPLRTGAISTIFALCCAMIVRWHEKRMWRVPFRLPERDD